MTSALYLASSLFIFAVSRSDLIQHRMRRLINGALEILRFSINTLRWAGIFKALSQMNCVTLTPVNKRVCFMPVLQINQNCGDSPLQWIVKVNYICAHAVHAKPQSASCSFTDTTTPLAAIENGKSYNYTEETWQIKYIDGMKLAYFFVQTRSLNFITVTTMPSAIYFLISLIVHWLSVFIINFVKNLIRLDRRILNSINFTTW